VAHGISTFVIRCIYDTKLRVIKATYPPKPLNLRVAITVCQVYYLFRFDVYVGKNVVQNLCRKHIVSDVFGSTEFWPVPFPWI